MQITRSEGLVSWNPLQAGAALGAAESPLAQSTLREIDELFRAAFTHARVGIAITDPHGRFLRVNAAYCRITGYDEAELLACDFADITHPDDRALNRADAHRMLRGEIPSFVSHKRFVAKHGAIVWVQNSVSMARDASGAPRHVIVLTEDITARRQAEQRLEEEHEWLALALGAGQMGLWEWNFTTGERRWNEAMYQLYGVDPKTVRSLAPPHVEEILPEDRDRLQQEIVRLRATGGTTQVEFRIRRRTDGEVRWISSRGTVRNDAARGIERMLGVSYDITERKAAEQRLIEADRRKDEFLAMLAHELRNPLAPLTNALRLLERSARLDGPDRAVLAMAERQTAQLKRLVDDLLEVSRITRGKIALKREPMAVGQAVRDAVGSVACAIEARAQTLAVELPAQPVRIVADAARVAQVLENLLNNASKYTAEGGAIAVQVREAPAHVEIRVRDNGIGIEPQRVEQIFELFAQLDDSIDRSQGGLGIGLALVKRLVELHGGTVSAASEGPGKGAVFTVRLPREMGGR